MAKKNFPETLASLHGVYVLKKFCIGWDLLDGIKKWHIYLHLIEDLNYLIHVWILLIIFQPVRKWYYRLVHLTC